MILFQLIFKVCASFDPSNFLSLQDIFNDAPDNILFDSYLSDSKIINDLYVPHNLTNFVVKPK